MPPIHAWFDRSGSVPRPPYRRLLREGWARLAYRPHPPDPAALPHGHGHVVLVIPGFLTADATTRPLRRFLGHCGFRAFGWGLGRNVGPTRRVRAGLRRRLAELRRVQGGPISVVGVSLGGLLARDLAYDRPGDIRHVVTVVSPVRLPTASPLEPLIRVCAPFYCPTLDAGRLAVPLAVPSTAIYSRDDGMVAWQTCRAADGRDVEVSGAHVTICRNPDVLRTIAQRLAARTD